MSEMVVEEGKNIKKKKGVSEKCHASSRALPRHGGGWRTGVDKKEAEKRDRGNNRHPCP
jgi:hypothetical protein